MSLLEQDTKKRQQVEKMPELDTSNNNDKKYQGEGYIRQRCLYQQVRIRLSIKPLPFNSVKKLL